MSSLPNQQPELDPKRWVTADALGIGDRRALDLFKEFKPLGAAKLQCKVKFFDSLHPAIAKRIRATRKDRSYDDLSGFSEKQIETARHKVWVVETGFTEISKREKEARVNRGEAVEWYCQVRLPELGKEPVAVRTFYRWETTYLKAGSFKVRGLIDTRGRKVGQQIKCSPEAWEYFKGYYLDDRKLTLQFCWKLTRIEAGKQGWTWPTRRSIGERVDREIPHVTLVLKREGRAAFEAKCQPRIDRDYDDVPAGDVWCADEHTMDLFARYLNGKGQWKTCRPKLTALLDVRSRMFVGWRISHQANSDTIVAAFKLAMRTFGPPVSIHCDNGTDYKSVARRGKSRKWAKLDEQYMTGLYSTIGVNVHWAIPYEPWSKMIESHFRKVCNEVSKLFETYCGNKPGARPESCETRIDRLPTVEEVAAVFSEWLEVFHAEPSDDRKGTFGFSPNQAMRQFRGPQTREKIDGAFLDFLCARTVGPVKVGKNGVRWQGVYYGQGNPTLIRLQKKEVLLKIQPDRADVVSVCDLQGRLLVEAKNDRLTGATQEDMRTAASRRKRTLRIANENKAEVPIFKRTPIRDIITAQKIRENSDSIPVGDPPPTVQLVRPDLRDSVEAVSQKKKKRAAKPVDEAPLIDFAAFDNEFGIGNTVSETDNQVDSELDNVGNVLFENEYEEPDPAREALPDFFEVLKDEQQKFA